MPVHALSTLRSPSQRHRAAGAHHPDRRQGVMRREGTSPQRDPARRWSCDEGRAGRRQCEHGHATVCMERDRSAVRTGRRGLDHYGTTSKQQEVGGLEVGIGGAGTDAGAGEPNCATARRYVPVTTWGMKVVSGWNESGSAVPARWTAASSGPTLAEAPSRVALPASSGVAFAQTTMAQRLTTATRPAACARRSQRPEACLPGRRPRLTGARREECRRFGDDQKEKGCARVEIPARGRVRRTSGNGRHHPEGDPAGHRHGEAGALLGNRTRATNAATATTRMSTRPGPTPSPMMEPAVIAVAVGREWSTEVG